MDSSVALHAVTSAYFVALSLFAISFDAFGLALATVGVSMWAKLLLRIPRRDAERFVGPNRFSFPCAQAVFCGVFALHTQHVLGAVFSAAHAASFLLFDNHDLFDVVGGWLMGVVMATILPIHAWNAPALLAASFSGIVLWWNQICEPPIMSWDEALEELSNFLQFWRRVCVCEG